MSFKIERNDITKVSADAIVNTANPMPTVGAGTDTAIYKAAGYEELIEERRKIGVIPRGESRATPSFKLEKNGVKFIIHTIGVFWQGGSKGETDILRSCYKTSLKTAVDLGCKSIAIPFLATGSYCFPKELALQIAVEEISKFLLENEIAYIKEAVEAPERPFVAILGGSKLSDNIGVIENLLEKADKVLIGGGMTYTFYKAQGIEIGNSLVEEDKLDVAKALLEKSNGKLILPVDSKEANAFADYTEVKDTEGEAVDPGFLGLDIGPKSIAEFDKALTGAKTVVWNGPMGVFENPDFQAGTIGVMDAIVKQPGVKSIIGGGDSAAAAINLGRADKFSWISTGGGASMELLEGKELPGLAALTDK